jgi:hypothetical protein
MQRGFTFPFVYQNNENMIHCLWVIKKGELFIFFSLSFSHFTMIYKKRTSLLTVKMKTDTSNHGKDTFRSICRYFYLLFYYQQ